MHSPIVNNRYDRKGVVFDLADDFSAVTVTQDGRSVILEGNAVADLLQVMSANVYADGDDLAARRLWNIVPTSHSAPDADWS